MLPLPSSNETTSGERAPSPPTSRRRSVSPLTAHPATTTPQPCWKKSVRCIVLTGVVSAIVWVAKDLSAGDASWIGAANASLVVWLEHHPGWGVLAVIGLYIVATICFVPGSLLTIGTSFAFGKAFSSTWRATLLASSAVFVGASLGSISCFLLGRYLFRDPVERLAQNYPIILAFDRAMLNKGFYIMLMLRLSPLVPYNALDYLSGITSISLLDYSLAMIGLVPGTVVFCFIGATASDLTEGKMGNSQTVVAVILGLVFAAASVGLASYYSRIELEKLMEETGETGRHQRQEYDSLSRDEEDRSDDGIEATFEAA